jgi:hypothetical protein
MFSDPELQVAKIQATGFISFEALRDASFLCPGKRPKLKLAGTKLGKKAKADADRAPIPAAFGNKPAGSFIFDPKR